MIKDYLIENQPLFYQVINNEFHSNKIPHAYLLVGTNYDKPLQYLKMSLLCNETVACENCVTCQKVLNNQYADIMEFDGEEESIKVAHIENIQSTFKKSGFEGKNRIYVIKNIDKAGVAALNKLLKLLEEPEEGVYAIFTTTNMNMILPTIISRCQVLKLKPYSKNEMKDILISKEYNEEQANLLSILLNDLSEIDQIDIDTFDYIALQAIDFIEDLFKARNNLIINTQLHILMEYNSKKSNIGKKEIKLFLNMIVLGLKDMFHVKHNTDIVFCKHLDLIQSLEYDSNDLIKKIELILETIYLIDTNANIPLLMDSMMYRL